MSEIGRQRVTREYRNKETIYSQGDAANAMFYVESGHVKLTVASTHGKKAVLAILGKGDFFGQCCLVKGARRPTTATSLQSSTVTSVERSALNEIIQREPKFSSLFVFDLLSRIGRVEEDFTDHLLHSSEMRLARLLLRLSHFGERNAADSAVLHVSQETLAEMVGTTRSRVSYFMNRFRESGLIDYNGSLHVHKALRTFLLCKLDSRMWTAVRDFRCGIQGRSLTTSAAGATPKDISFLPFARPSLHFSSLSW